MRYIVTSLPIASILLSAAGRNGYFVAVTWTLASEDEGSASVAVFLLICSLGELATNRIGGMIIDRADPRIICIACDIGRIAAVMSIGAGPSWHLDRQMTAYGSVAFYSAFDRTYVSALQSVLSTLPAAARSGRLVSASYIAMQTGNLIASLAVGWLVALTGEIGALWFIVASFLASSAFMLTLLKIAPPLIRSLQGRTTTTLSDQAKDAGTSRALMSLGLQYGLIYTMGMLLSVLAASYVRQALIGSAADYGTIEAAWSVGAISGGLISLIDRKQPGRSKLAVHMFIAGFALFVLWATTDTSIAAGGMVIAGTCYTLSRVFVDREIFRIVPANGQGLARGRVHSTCVAISLTSYTAIAGFGGHVAPEQIIGLFGAVMVVAAAFLLVRLPNESRRLDGGPKT